MDIVSINPINDGIQLILHHKRQTFGVIMKYCNVGDGHVDSITDYIAVAGNVNATARYKVNIEYGSIFRRKIRTLCCKIIINIENKVVDSYVDGVLTNTHDISDFI